MLPWSCRSLSVFSASSFPPRPAFLPGRARPVVSAAAPLLPFPRLRPHPLHLPPRPRPHPSIVTSPGLRHHPLHLPQANALDFATSRAANRILPMGLFVRVPTRCAYDDGVHKSVSVRYAARPADTLATVADSVFAGLASADQIRNANDLTSADPDAPLDAGQQLVRPLPCVCFHSSDNNLLAVYLSYVVQIRDTVPAIATSYETTVTDIMNVNAMGGPSPRRATFSRSHWQEEVKIAEEARTCEGVCSVAVAQTFSIYIAHQLHYQDHAQACSVVTAM